MYDPSIPGVDWRMQYDRLERMYLRLQAGNRSSTDYGDDLQHFLQDCLHLADWIGRDKATGIGFGKIRNEMNDEVRCATLAILRTHRSISSSVTQPIEPMRPLAA